MLNASLNMPRACPKNAQQIPHSCSNPVKAIMFQRIPDDRLLFITSHHHWNTIQRLEVLATASSTELNGFHEPSMSAVFGGNSSHLLVLIIRYRRT